MTKSRNARTFAGGSWRDPRVRRCLLDPDLESSATGAPATVLPTVILSKMADMDGGSVERLELHLPGLLQLLGESLYSDPRVAYRELVQNAHDACVRRELAEPGDYQPKIEVTRRIEAGETWIAIADNGEGLDADDIRQFLSTIGRGQTGELRSVLEARGASDHERLVGRFGIGLLSAFLVADRVEVRTRRGDRGNGYRWICEGKQTYRLEPYERETRGSEVVLRIRKDRRELGKLEVIEDAVAHFARYLPIPITVAGTPINAAMLPWAAQPGREVIAIDDLARMWCRLGEPLAALELQPFEDPELGRVALHGVLVIPEGSQLSVHELGDVGVLIRRMLIAPRERELLPPWARFVTGLVDCPVLEPTASREQVRRGPELVAVQRGIAKQLLAWLERLQAQPETWTAILEGHGAIVKTWAARHRELFDVVADHVRYRTTRGTMTLPAYLDELGEHAVYYFDDEVEARAMALLLESSARPVIDAMYTGDVAFLHAYADARGIKLVRQLEAEQGALTPLASPPPELALLASWLVEPDLAVEVARFAPSSLPGFVRVPPRTTTQERARRALDAASVHSSLRSLLGDYATRAPEQARRTLFLNADNPLIQQLAARASHDPTNGGPLGHARSAAQLVSAMARLVAGETLAPSSLLAAYQAASAALGALIGADAASPGRPIPIGWATETVGLSPRHARLVIQHFPTFEALSAANDRELAETLGLPVAMATALRTLAGETP